MKMQVIIKTIVVTIVINLVSLTGAMAATLEAFSNQGCLDIDGSYLNGNTSAGDLVQLIWTGADNAINPADELGNVTGDDILLGTMYVGYGTITGVTANGRFSRVYSNDALVIGRKVYIRVWNSPIINGLQDAYGDSPLHTLTTDIDHHDFGQVQCIERQSTPVELTNFNASAQPGKVVIKWTTQSETENLGFHIYRCESIDGDKVRITDEMINGAINSQSRNDYEWVDNQIQGNQIYYYWLADVSTDGVVQFSEASKAIGIAKPEAYSLSQNFPNPFNPSTNIKYTLKDDGNVKLAIFNIRGQLVRTLVDARQSAGEYTQVWNGQDNNGTVLPSGIYFYTIQVNEFKITKKMSFTK